MGKATLFLAFQIFLPFRVINPIDFLSDYQILIIYYFANKEMEQPKKLFKEVNVDKMVGEIK